MVCDYNFFEKYCSNILDYQKSSCQIPYVLGVFSVLNESALVAERLNDFRESNCLNKFFPFVYGNSNLEWILSRQSDSEIQWDYKINYIEVLVIILLKSLEFSRNLCVRE